MSTVTARNWINNSFHRTSTHGNGRGCCTSYRGPTLTARNEIFCKKNTTVDCIECILTYFVLLQIQNHALGIALGLDRPVSLLDLNEEYKASLASMLGFPLETYLCIPVKHPETGVIAVMVCLVNYKSEQDNERLVSLVKECFW